MEVTKWTEALRCKRVAVSDSASAQAVTRVNAICSVAHMAFNALFPVMRCWGPIPL